MITEKGRIRESFGNGGSGRVPNMWDPGEYREGKNSGEFRKWGIRASTENMESGQVPER